MKPNTVVTITDDDGDSLNVGRPRYRARLRQRRRIRHRRRHRMITVRNWLGYTIAIVDSPVDAYYIARLHIGATITPTA